MRRLRTLLTIILLVLLFCLILYLVGRGGTIAVLQPTGEIATKQKNLIIFATLLSLIVVIPVFAMTTYFAWKYRESNSKAAFKPEWGNSRALEFVWWGVPLVLILILSVVTWKSTHELDPFKPLVSTTKPIKVQVIALDWKWLFIYPDENIATINYLRIPEDTPVDFSITSDAPMNAFWVPQLGGQVYAMSGMTTELHLIADEPGRYEGVSSNISGSGFAKMRFSIEATSRGNYEDWVSSIRQNASTLNSSQYSTLIQQSTEDQSKRYGSVEYGLYNMVMSKYMTANHDDMNHKYHTKEEE